MPLSNLEYLPLRLLRRFVFSDAFLLRWGRLLPYYRTNHNQADPAPLAEAYLRHWPAVSTAETVLEIGVGATNSTGYELAARNPRARIVLLEPFVAFDPALDRKLLAEVAARHRCAPETLTARVRRVTSLATEPNAAHSVILSTSVLEHVAAPAALFAALRRVLRPDGVMLHLVDYRDHFFKYPLHFLQFRKAVWSRWLDPGDLPRWRLYDHIEALEAAGFAVSLPEIRHDPAAFARIAPQLSPDFRKDDPRVGVTFAALLAQPVPR